ncbi:MAG: hypothetical protein AAGG02_04165 [Cyanobacteria bacterium P01_H01_bin.15]
MIRLLISAVIVIGGSAWIAQNYLGTDSATTESIQNGEPAVVEQYRDNLNDALEKGTQRNQQAIDELEGSSGSGN